jgi:glycosyltransferase involved in cell wall biosynthesis
MEVSGIHIPGFVKDLGLLLTSSKVFVSPVVGSTGITTKNVLAMASGLPVVTTTFGTRSLGIPVDMDFPVILCADEPEAFADAVVCVSTDPVLWTRISRSAYEHAYRRFSRNILQRDVEALVRVVRKIISQKRTKLVQNVGGG